MQLYLSVQRESIRFAQSRLDITIVAGSRGQVARDTCRRTLRVLNYDIIGGTQSDVARRVKSINESNNNEP